MGENNGYLPFPKGFATKAICEAQEPEQWDSMAMVTPLVTASVFKQHGPRFTDKDYLYSRAGHPTRNSLEKCLASLENAKHGLCFASGLGAVTSIMAMFQAGDHMITDQHIYGGTSRIFSRIISKYNIETTSLNCMNIDAIEKVISSNTKAIWIETPGNPTLQVIDIRAVCNVAKKHGLLVIVDNTFLTPYLQRPLDLGADIVLHSLSKYINGHMDVLMGAVLTSNEAVYEQLKFLQNALGIIPSPFDCHQVLRSLKTLNLRMEQHQKNGLIVAKFLEQHPKVQKVVHPGLPSHPQFEVTKRQTSGHSGMIGIYLKGNIETSSNFLKSLKLITIAGSLGAYKSLAEIPFVMTHKSMSQKLKDVLEITDNYIRLSVGLEDAMDLVSDLQQALENEK